AHIEGKGIVTQDAAGLAQKGGATWSHVLIADDPAQIHTTRIAMAEAELVLGCDPIVAADRETLARVRKDRTFVALNTHGAPTAALVHQPQWQFPEAACHQALEQAVGAGQIAGFDADALARRVLGDSIYANPMMLGFAWQKGWIPLRRESLLRAIELNEVAVAQNRAAFEWGRHAAAHPQQLAALGATEQVIAFARRPGLDELVRTRSEFLSGYQNAAYASSYQDLVTRVAQAESALGSKRLSEAVARTLFKLMAYKDEYEVARLHSDPSFARSLREQFDGDFKLRYHMAPPLFSRPGPDGRPRKIEFGPWMGTALRLLRHGKVLRGSAFDPFGRSEERRAERALIQRYRESVESLLAGLRADNLDLAVRVAEMPSRIAGYGPVKQRSMEQVLPQWEALLQQWRAAAQPAPAAPAPRGATLPH
ncbi:MAG: 2-oxoacid:acceptor oxidoreductase family protein, partial [Betaproteobacteria bacterium]|nr:2-oxoacid:acceptor oxidoreductase family protein [Betaproteobacteria bacterium]